MAGNTYEWTGGPHKGQSILILPDKRCFVVEEKDLQITAFTVEGMGRPLDGDDVRVLLDQRAKLASLLARALEVAQVEDEALHAEIEAALETW